MTQFRWVFKLYIGRSTTVIYDHRLGTGSSPTAMAWHVHVRLQQWTLPARGLRKGAEGSPLGVFGPLRAESPRGSELLRRHPKPTQKSRNLCGNPLKKHVRTVEGPLTIWIYLENGTTRKNRIPLGIRGPSEYQAPLWAPGALLEAPDGPRTSWYFKGPLWASGGSLRWNDPFCLAWALKIPIF